MSEFLPKMTYSRWKKMKECPRKFYEHHERPDNLAIDLTPMDTHRAFIGTAVQHIMEIVINERWYKKESQETIFDMIDNDLKLMKPLIVETSSLTEPVDGWNRQPLPDANILKDIQQCAVDTSDSYNIHIARNTVVKKIREMYKKPLSQLLARDDVDMMQSEYKFRCKSKYFFHQGELDFYIDYGSEFAIIDGKKSASSFLDDDQLYHYRLMAELVTGKKCRHLGFLVYDEDQLKPVDNLPDASEDLLNRMWEKHCSFQKYKAPGDYPMHKSYGACMFCDINDNCLARNTSKEEVTEI